MTIPKTMSAVKVRGPNDLFIDSTAPVPAVRPGHLLIKVLSVALNPTDWKRVAIFREEVPHTVGLDVAGRVVACGDNIGQEYNLGDRVAGLCYGIKAGDPLSGAFGEYALLKGALSLPVPDHVSDAEAATIPVGTNFVGQALYKTLNLSLPSPQSKPKSSGPTILIYGGATASGMFGLQFARLSGCHVLTTCSPRNFQLVKGLGAYEAFDYHDSGACAAAIRLATADKLLYAFDCVTAGSSLQICADALTSQPGVAAYTAALPISAGFPRKDVRAGWTSGYSAFGDASHLSGSITPDNPSDDAFAADFWRVTAKLLKQDRLRLGPLVHGREGGLKGIAEGLVELKDGDVSAGKLVYTIEQRKDSVAWNMERKQ